MRKGCDFDVFAVVTNNTHSEKKCRLVFGSCAVSYSGQVGGNCGFKDLLNVELAPGGGQSRVRRSHPGGFFDSFLIGYIACGLCIYPERAVPLRLNYSKYGDLLTDDSLIRLAVLLLDYSTREPALAVRNIVLKDPEIKVRVCAKAARRQAPKSAGCSLDCFSSVGCVLQILGEPKQNRRLAAEITLQNPLPEPLQDCCFSIEGANLTGGRVISERFAQAFLRSFISLSSNKRALVHHSQSCCVRFDWFSVHAQKCKV